AFHLAFLLPVSPRQGAPFNTPYPGWIAAPLALVAQALVAGLAARRALGGDVTGVARTTSVASAARVLGAGVAAGVAFSVKPNAGLLALAGAGLALVPGWPAAEGFSRCLALAVRAAAVLSALVLLGGAALEPGYTLALVLPVVLAAVWTAPVAPQTASRPLLDAVLLVVGFVLPVLVWLPPLVHELGWARFAREVLLLDGGGVVAAYLLPFALPEAPAAALCAGVGLALVLLRVAPRATAVALVVGLATPLALDADASARIVAEQACLWLGPLVLALGLVLVPSARDTAGTHALLAFAALFALQLFPRPDLIHVAMSAPSVLLAAGAVVQVLLRRMPADRAR